MSVVLKKFTDQYFASCPKGLEVVLVDELKKLGATKVEVASRGVHFNAKKTQIGKIILYSRITSSLYLKLFDFDVKKEKDLYQGIRSINWPRLFKDSHTLKFSFSQGVSPKLKKKSQFTNLKYLSFVAKDGYVDRFKLENKERPNVDLDEPDVLINCHLEPHDQDHTKKERVTVLLDLIGFPLCHRGYRAGNQKAPVRENLAAGILDLIKWDPENETFVDLMCGSGTFVIESLIKKYSLPARFKDVRILCRNIEKQRWNLQKYSFLSDITQSQEFKNDLEQAGKVYQNFLDSKPPFKIIANDFHSYVIKELQETIARLRWGEYIRVTNNDATQTNLVHDKKCLLFSNPPYGQRIGNDMDELEDLYFYLGENFKQNYKLSRWAIMSANKDLLKKIRLKASSKDLVSHGSLDCHVYTYNQL